MKVGTQVVTAVVAIATALGIGYIMQSSESAQNHAASRSAVAPDVSRSAMLPNAPHVAIARLTQPPRQSLARKDLWIDGVLVPAPPSAPDLALTQVSAPAYLAAIDTGFSTITGAPTEPRSGFGLPCKVEAQATPLPGALVQVDLEATCHPHERVTFLHEGLRFTEIMSNIGRLSVKIPALTEDAQISIMFDDGEGVEVSAPVDDLRLYDRVALQWRGPMGLHIHALEQNARYGEEGHVWAGNPGELLRGENDRGGALIQLGDARLNSALLAEVYSYPVRMKGTTGVRLSIEAEITVQNCGRAIEGQTLQRMVDGTIKSVDLNVSVPGCSAVGDFLVLKNLVQDLTLAQN